MTFEYSKIEYYKQCADLISRIEESGYDSEEVAKAAEKGLLFVMPDPHDISSPRVNL